MLTAATAPTILVVEDDTLIRMVGADLIADAGFHVLEAASADEALAILEGAQVELLFSDIDMPGSMDGLALAEVVHKRWPCVKLLLTSGHHKLPDSEVPDHGHFVAKPYDHDRLVDQIRKQLEASS
jgi:DNA-binding NtrC family response regulator